MISRLVSHKGLDLVKAVIEDILQTTSSCTPRHGGRRLRKLFQRPRPPLYGKVATVIAFNGDLSRKIYSGADIFLMPSKSEPCGLSQMIASRYAAVPVVRETGGLFDSIKPYGSGGNGFTFAAYNPYDMLYVVREAVNTYKNGKEWASFNAEGRPYGLFLAAFGGGI